MAVNGYMAFKGYDQKFLPSESQVDSSRFTDGLWVQPFKIEPKSFFEIEDYSLDTEQTLNIGSQSTGAGAGKITFNPFSVTRKVDALSPVLFGMSCAGKPFAFVTLILRKAAGGSTAASPYLRYDLKLVAVKTIAWLHDDESPKERVTFEYGGLQIRYAPQNPDGSFGQPVVSGWNRVRNVLDTSDAVIQ